MRLVARLLLLVLLYVWPLAADAAGKANLFRNEAEAQKHCPTDAVVWLNLPTGIYHMKGQRYYANTKSGAFVCKKEADADGDRPSRNGQ